MAALCDELAEYGPFHLFRPYNDLRFAKNRPPYKTAQGASCETDGGSGYYVHLSAEGLMTAAGCYVMAKDQLQRFREAVDDDTTGTEIAALVAELGRRGFDVGAHDELKTAPRGYAKDHPRVDLLRRSGSDGVADVAGRSVDARQAGGDEGAQGMADGGAAVHLARHPRRSEHDGP